MIIFLKKREVSAACKRQQTALPAARLWVKGRCLR